MNSDDKKARKKEAITQVRAVQAILGRWDPMDLAPGEFAPADEYDGYAHEIVSLVAKGCSVEQLSGYLQGLRTSMVCMRDNAERNREVASEIVAALRGEAIWQVVQGVIALEDLERSPPVQTV